MHTLSRLLQRLPLLRHRYLASCMLILFLPMSVHVGGLMLNLESTPRYVENRVLASRPIMPQDAKAWLAFPAQMDAYVNDHFGLRQSLIAWHNQARYLLLNEAASPQLSVGKNGFLFFNAHEAAHPRRMSDFLCGQFLRQTGGQAIVEELAQEVHATMQQAMRQHARTSLAFVPTKPVLYPENLPAWMQEECAKGTPTLPAFLRQLAKLDQINLMEAQPVNQAVSYPLAAMQAQKEVQLLYPKPNFHWHGKGAQVFAQSIAEQDWHLTAKRSFQFVPETLASDMQSFMPGIALNIDILTPDYAAAGVEVCLGGSCFPESRTAAKLGDVSRYRAQKSSTDNTEPTKKLLIISDSFGQGGAGYFSAYFDEVWHVSINNTGALNAAERAELQGDLSRYAPDRVLYLFHDYSLVCFSNRLGFCPVPLRPILGQLQPNETRKE